MSEVISVGIEVKNAKVFYAPTRRRRYFSLDAAIKAEAIAIIKNRYPDIDEIHIPYHEQTGEWFHWREDIERSDVLFRRMCKLIRKEYLKSK
jgi:hypothetical protein